MKQIYLDEQSFATKRDIQFIAVVIAITLIAGFWTITMQHYDALAENESCSVYKTQKDAQAHYSRDLDRDNDGKACEALP